MTREEAIEALNEIFDDSEFSRYESWYGTAMDMAIEALSNNITESSNEAIKRQNDVIEVVRCKDCRWWNSETKGCKRNPSVKAWQEDDFCKYGKRWSNAID